MKPEKRRVDGDPTWTSRMRVSSSTVISEKAGRLEGTASQHLCINSNSLGWASVGRSGLSPWEIK